MSPRSRRLFRRLAALLLLAGLGVFALARPVDVTAWRETPLAEVTLASLDERLAAQGAPPAYAKLEMGVSRVEIAPPLDWDVPMAGNRGLSFRRAEGTRPESVWARALALRQAERALLLVSADIMVISPELSDRVLERVGERAGLSSGEVLLVAAHTHNGPGGYWEGTLPEQSVGPYDERVLDYLVESFSDVAIEAWESMGPARVSAGRRQMEAPIRNRAGRIELENATLELLRFESIEDGGSADLVNFSAHPVSMLRSGHLLTGDYPALMAARVETDNRTLLFAPGSIGDMKPVWDGVRDPLGKGTQIASHLVEEGLERIELATLRDPVLESFEIDLPMPPLQPRIVRSDWAGSWAVRDWLARSLFPGHLKQTVVQVARLGRVALIGAPSDLASSVALPLIERGRRQGLEVQFISMADDWIGYVMEESEYLHRDYKETSQFHGPQSGPMFTAVYERLIDWLATRVADPDDEEKASVAPEPTGRR